MQRAKRVACSSQQVLHCAKLSHNKNVIRLIQMHSAKHTPVLISGQYPPLSPYWMQIYTTWLIVCCKTHASSLVDNAPHSLPTGLTQPDWRRCAKHPSPHPVLWVDNALYSLSPLDADLRNLTDKDVRCKAHCSTLVDNALHSLPTGCKSTQPDWPCCWPRTCRRRKSRKKEKVSKPFFLLSLEPLSFTNFMQMTPIHPWPH